MGLLPMPPLAALPVSLGPLSHLPTAPQACPRLPTLLSSPSPFPFPPSCRPGRLAPSDALAPAVREALCLSGRFGRGRGGPGRGRLGLPRLCSAPLGSSPALLHGIKSLGIEPSGWFGPARAGPGETCCVKWGRAGSRPGPRSACGVRVGVGAGLAGSLRSGWGRVGSGRAVGRLGLSLLGSSGRGSAGRGEVGGFAAGGVGVGSGGRSGRQPGGFRQSGRLGSARVGLVAEPPTVWPAVQHHCAGRAAGGAGGRAARVRPAARGRDDAVVPQRRGAPLRSAAAAAGGPRPRGHAMMSPRHHASRGVARAATGLEAPAGWRGQESWGGALAWERPGGQPASDRCGGWGRGP